MNNLEPEIHERLQTPNGVKIGIATRLKRAKSGIQRCLKNSAIRQWQALAIRNNASMEMIFSPRSTSPTYLGLRWTRSASVSCVNPRRLRCARMASPRNRRWAGIIFRFRLDCATSAHATRRSSRPYTSNKLVFIDLPSRLALRQIAARSEGGWEFSFVRRCGAA